MTHPKRGMAVIINNRVFDRRTQMGERTGTDVDAANLYQVFKKLGFEVHMFNNQKTTDMLKIMSEGITMGILAHFVFTVDHYWVAQGLGLDNGYFFFTTYTYSFYIALIDIEYTAAVLRTD